MSVYWQTTDGSLGVGFAYWSYRTYPLPTLVSPVPSDATEISFSEYVRKRRAMSAQD